MRSAPWVIIALVMLVTVGTARAANDIGVAAAVTKDVTGKTKAGVRKLSTGDNVFQRETIETQRASTAQLLFRDETTLTVGPKSSVVLDKFVYDPHTNLGTTVIDATKGFFRFVSGSADPRGYEIRTPAASFGIRGTIIDFYVDDDGNVFVILVDGATRICNAVNRCFTLDQRGTYLRVAADGTFSGPADWDGTIWQTSDSGITWPLNGRRWIGDQPTFDLPSDLRDLNQALDGVIPLPPPMPPPVPQVPLG